jgi:hypothetical protein
LNKGRKLVLGSIKAAHARIGLRPDDEIERFKPEFSGRGVNRRLAAPIDEGPQNAALAKIACCRLDPSDVERQKLFGAHLTRRHCEFAMSAACDMTGDRAAP